MPKPLAEGVYEHLVTEAVQQDLTRLDPQIGQAILGLDEADAHLALARHLGQEVARVLGPVPAKERVEIGRQLVSRLIGEIASLKGAKAEGVEDQRLPAPARQLMALHRGSVPERPATPLAVSTLLTRNRAEPSLGHELAREIAIADRVEAVVAFVTVSGVRAILEALQTFARKGDGLRLRLLTTVFNGITEREALDQIGGLPGVEVKVSYDVRRTRLHAKAWLFHRDSGPTTAYGGFQVVKKPTSGAIGAEVWTIRNGKKIPGGRPLHRSREGAGQRFSRSAARSGWSRTTSVQFAEEAKGLIACGLGRVTSSRPQRGLLARGGRLGGGVLRPLLGLFEATRERAELLFGFRRVLRRDRLGRRRRARVLARALQPCLGFG